MKIRLEGNKQEIARMEQVIQIGIRQQGIQLKSVSNFYPNKAFGFERSEPQKEGRVYIEIE